MRSNLIISVDASHNHVAALASSRQHPLPTGGNCSVQCMIGYGRGYDVAVGMNARKSVVFSWDGVVQYNSSIEANPLLAHSTLAINLCTGIECAFVMNRVVVRIISGDSVLMDKDGVEPVGRERDREWERKHVASHGLRVQHIFCICYSYHEGGGYGE